MANIMTKRGTQDNVVTYQHFCDTTADLANIESKYCTLGSIAIVLQGDSGGLQIYIANSDKQWNPLTSGIGGGNGGGVANLPLEIVNPSNDDVLTYDSTNGKWINKAATSGGSGGGNFVVHDNNGTLDKTWKEIHDALGAGYYVIVLFYNESDETFEHVQITIAGTGDGYYQVAVGIAMFQDWYKTDSENGYPVLDRSNDND